MFNIGPPEILLILLIALVVVGPAKLPELGRSIGKGLREFRKVQDEVRDSINFNLDVEPDTPAPKSHRPRTVEADRAAEVADVAPAPDPADDRDTADGDGADDPPPPGVHTTDVTSAVDTRVQSSDAPPAEDPDTSPPGDRADTPAAEDPETAISPAAGAPSTNGSTPPPAEE